MQSSSPWSIPTGTAFGSQPGSAPTPQTQTPIAQAQPNSNPYPTFPNQFGLGNQMGYATAQAAPAPEPQTQPIMTYNPWSAMAEQYANF